MMGKIKNNTPNIDKFRHTPSPAYDINTTDKQTTLMLQKAISSGFRNGLNIKAGKLNAARKLTGGKRRKKERKNARVTGRYKTG